jgi:hypothetical protein
MRPVMVLGFVLIVAGIVGLAMEYVVFSETRAILEAGQFKITARTDRPFPIPTLIGLLALAAGGALLYFGRRPANR